MAVSGDPVANGMEAIPPSLMELPREAQALVKVQPPASGFFGTWRQWLANMGSLSRHRTGALAQMGRRGSVETGMSARELSSGTGSEPTSDGGAALRLLARRALGYTGADIERLVREARQKARRERRALTFADLDGLLSASRPAMSPEMRRRMAIHEAGHVLARILLGVGELTAVTIDTASGGFTESTFQEDLDSEERCQRYLVAMMAGRAAEQVVLGSTHAGSGGALQSDLARATQLATAMETSLGFGRRQPLLYRDPGDWQGLIRQDKPLATRVHRRLRHAETSARKLIRRHRARLDMITDELDARGTIEGQDLVVLVARVRGSNAAAF